MVMPIFFVPGRLNTTSIRAVVATSQRVEERERESAETYFIESKQNNILRKMGGCCSSSSAVVVDKNKIASDKKNSSSPVPVVTRTGVEGLSDFGFEYRLHEPCPKHKTNSNTLISDGNVLTHHTKHQNEEEEDVEREEMAPPPISSPPPSTSRKVLGCTDCSLRLFRKSDNTMITTDNRKQTIPPRIYDRVAQVAQQTVISWLEIDYNMHSLPLFTTTMNNEEKTVHALVSDPPPPSSSENDEDDKGTVLIINGRGVAKAGILSTRHTIESGIEKGSAVLHVHHALERDMAVICLDSNALGSTNGLDTVCRSLSSEALKPYLSSNRSLYILCHSAAGGNLVQHLLKTHHINNKSSNVNGSDTATFSNKPLFTLKQIKALVFTDSTHDLQWLSLKQNPIMCDFLQCDSCLYIRNNREHISNTFGPNHKDQPAGKPFSCHISNPQWLKRFGTIHTVYAGTTDHSLMCYQARRVIWAFFDSKRLGTTKTPSNACCSSARCNTDEENFQQPPQTFAKTNNDFKKEMIKEY